MVWTKGEDNRHLWRRMDAPERVGTCDKLREGQRLMQRYKFLFHHYRLHDLYSHQSTSAKDKSLVLAKRMVEHATNCAKCTEDNVLEEETFYGVYK